MIKLVLKEEMIKFYKKEVKMKKNDGIWYQNEIIHKIYVMNRK